MSDYHVHLHPHEPAEGGPPPGTYPHGHIEAFVEHAAARGVTEIGFTEHLYRCREAAPALGRFWEYERRLDLAEHTRFFVEADQTLSLDTYVETVLEGKDAGLPVKLGLEIDFFPDTFAAVLELIDPYPWDYLIGSVHWVGGWAIDSRDQIHEFERRGVEQAWRDYFALEAELAATGGIDVLAHVDVCKKYGFRPESEPLDAYAEVVNAAAANGLAVEVSSQGLRNPAAEVYPSPAMLAMFHDAGVPITLASDAHWPHEAGHGTDEVRAAARKAGYGSYLRFEQRNRIEVPLDRS
jgi:histidinol-phosphatase (PHP family)